MHANDYYDSECTEGLQTLKMVMKLHLIFVTLLCSKCSFLLVNGQGEDLTREANVAGSSVVEAVVGLI